MIDSMAAPSFFLLRKGIKLIQKLMEWEEEFVREVAEGDKHYLRKVCNSQSTNQ